MVDESVEYRVKLAFIYNITKFVEWPASAYESSNAPFSIGIAGIDPFSPTLEAELRTRKVGTHPIEVRNMKPGGRACHVVFIPETPKDEAAGIVEGLKGSNTLTVGESEGFAARGGIINFVVEGHRLRVEVNLLAAERAGLKISSRLLSVATVVTDR